MNIDDVLSGLDGRVGVNGNNGAEFRYCDCSECIIYGVRVPMPPGHDCEYVRLRTALVKEAERIAGRLTTDNSRDWMTRFVTAMDELSKPLLNGE
jgi:hypothetical protein